MAPLGAQDRVLHVQAFMSGKYGIFLRLVNLHRPWITLEQLQDNHNVTDTAPPLSRYTASDETFEKIDTWLTNCYTKHPTCRRWQAITNTPEGLPTRLVQIEPVSGSLTPAIRLVRGLDLDIKTTRYATLSHCWGRKGVAVKLLSSNIEPFLHQIPWDILPLTFQEAILAATRLGLKYIWIDALCIIQDSETDWTIEASKMTQVYTNGYINISADASPDGGGGLFRGRDATWLQSFLVPPDGRDSNSQPYYCHIKNWDTYVEGAPLKQRYWVTQERFMSPRVVHFSGDQVHWECAELMTSESVAASFNVIPRTTRTPQKLLCGLYLHPDSFAELEQVYTLWHLLVESYTAAHLTFITDRPVAIAGLARTFSHLLKLQPRDYLCGLWRPRLAEEMMWSTHVHTSTERVSHSMPSWSWLSVNGHARMHTSYDANIECSPVVEAMNAGTTVLGDPYSTVMSGFLKVRAPLCRATILSTHEPGSELGDGYSDDQYSIALGPDELRYIHLRLDERPPDLLEKVLHQEVYLLLGRVVRFAEAEATDSTRSEQAYARSPRKGLYYMSSMGDEHTATSMIALCSYQPAKVEHSVGQDTSQLKESWVVQAELRDMETKTSIAVIS
ncbi:hypothetical protein PG996_003143 [Apiospora saccharicola]|uniref:Heterokaryon incompatibility domain-containing protein n=1 Tax=Apiospora saccharicola TaxID=335842 RepID=A0ABR1W0H5_9PEZI